MERRPVYVQKEKYKGNFQGVNMCTSAKEGELVYLFSEALQHSNNFHQETSTLGVGKSNIQTTCWEACVTNL